VSHSPARRRRLPALFPPLLAIALLLAASCSGPNDAAPRLTPLSAGATVLAFGDSITYGVGAGGFEPQPSLTYPEDLARQTGLTVVRSGVPGETTDRGLARLPWVLEQERPALVILEHGGNDFLGGRPEADTEKNLTAMVQACQQAGAQVLLLGVPQPGLLLRLHPVYARVAAATRVPLEPGLLPALLADSNLKSDLLHPNAQGYAKLAQGVAEALRKLGALPTDS
jgi:lysophospholipase L1-like esterase